MSKRILAIHDLSAFGHSSLLAAIPIFYHFGMRVCALPTVIMSANTLYDNPLSVDFSPWLPSFVQHWKTLGLEFDAIHSGFLAGPEQAALIEEAIDQLRGENTLVLVDPVMADEGRLYCCYDERMVDALRRLISKADLITPNYTEAALLLGKSYDPLDQEVDLKEWCLELSLMGPREVVITSAPTPVSGQLKTVCHTAQGYAETMFQSKEGLFPGAGDIFASFLLVGILKGNSTQFATAAAVKVMLAGIYDCCQEEDDWREGIALERLLQMDLFEGKA